MKKIIYCIFILLTTTTANAQHQIRILINDKNVGIAKANAEGTTSSIQLKKQKLTSIKKIRIYVEGNYANMPAYKKDLEVRLNDSSIIIVPEGIKSSIIGGYFDISKIKKLLTSGKKLLLTMLLNPANPKMMMPSRMVPLCYITMK